MKTEKNDIYKKLYYTLFNAVTDALHQLDYLDPVQCRKILMDAQQKCEEIYISGKKTEKII